MGAHTRTSTLRFLPGEEKRIREFYQSRGLDRVTQPSGEGMCLGRGLVRVVMSPEHSSCPALLSEGRGKGLGAYAILLTRLSLSEPALSNLGLPFSSFDHSKAHYYRYDEQLSLCLERLR